MVSCSEILIHNHLIEYSGQSPFGASIDIYNRLLSCDCMVELLTKIIYPQQNYFCQCMIVQTIQYNSIQ